MREADLAAEELTLLRFVTADRRRRLASVIRTKKGRLEIGIALAHGHPWDPRWVRRLPVHEQNPDAVEHILRSLGAPDHCHVLGDDDGGRLPLGEALADIVGSSIGALIICIPGRLAYHEGEERHDRNVLHRPAL